MAVLISACSGDSKPVGTVGHVKGFAGAVAGDEPAAVIAARDVLSAGGNAVDAAVTLYFSLAVTLPSTASLGGGGSCVVHDANKKVVEALDFQAPPVARQGELAMAVPSNARGIYALWARHGLLRWESLLAEPERMARAGTTVSRALASDLAVAALRLSEDAEARRLFFRADGRVLNEGDRMQNLDLAAIISWLRRAPGEIYVGQQAREIAAAAGRAGGGLSIEDLRDVRPQYVAGGVVPVGNDTAVLAPVRGDGGSVLSAMVKRRAAERPQMVAERVGAAAAQQGATGFRGYPPGTGFAVIDSFGNGVVCGMSANGLFGTGRVAPGTGIVLAAPPVGDNAAAVPALLVNLHSHEVHFAGVAGGGASPSAALAAALLAVADEERPLDQAAQAAGAGGGGSKVNLLACPRGGANGDCTVATDAKGFGYAVMVGRR